MLVDENDGLPVVGHDNDKLGVRRGIDVQFESDKVTVKLNRHGMSVARTWKGLPGVLVPPHLDNGVNGASGVGMAVFVHGEGDFAEGAVAPGLHLWFKKNPKGGIVCPTEAVTFQKLQADIENTRGKWVIDENE